MRYGIKTMKQAIRDMAGSYGEALAAVCVSAVYSFFFLLNSPLHPWTNQVTRTDSSVFKTVALMMEKGYMPYKDSFDHKGPLLYLLNYMGNLLSYYRGVWVVEFCFLTGTIYCIYKIARLSAGRLFSVMTTLISVSFLFDHFDGGNYTEEYAMPFIALSLYIFLDYFKNHVISSVRLAAAGFCFGAVVLLRANMIAVWIVFCVAVFIQVIAEKQWRRLQKFIPWFMLGAAVIIIPIGVWLAANGALEQCFKDYIVFNKEYVSSEAIGAVFSARWRAFFTFINTPTMILALIGILYHIKKQSYLHTTYFISMVVSLLLLSMSGQRFRHYGMVLLPLTAYPVSLIFQDIESIEKVETARAVGCVLVAYLLSSVIVPAEFGEFGWLVSMPARYEQREEDNLAQSYNGITDVIYKYTDEDDAISVYGNMDSIYVLSRRKHATRYSYQSPVGEVMPEIMEEYLSQLQEELPPLIIIQDWHFDDEISDFLTKNDYSFIWGERGEQKAGGTLVFFHQK